MERPALGQLSSIFDPPREARCNQEIQLSPDTQPDVSVPNSNALEMQPPIKCHFLVIENNPDEAFLIQRAFGKVLHPATVFICRSASEATSYLQGTEMYLDRSKYPLPYAIISDLNMPGESGLEFLRWLRAQSEFKALPTIILTGSSAPEQIREAYALGANKVLEKPPTLPALTAMIESLAQEWCHRAAGVLS